MHDINYGTYLLFNVERIARIHNDTSTFRFRRIIKKDIKFGKIKNNCINVKEKKEKQKKNKATR